MRAGLPATLNTKDEYVNRPNWVSKIRLTVPGHWPTVNHGTIVNKLPLGKVRPAGWLAEALGRQVTGLTGHIADSGYPFDTCLWAGDKMEGSPTAWWPYEQTAYFLDGAVRVGHLTGNAALLKLVRANHAWVRDHVLPSGRFGTVLTERWRHWPYASFARSLMADFEATGDRSLVELLHRHYLTFEPTDFADVLELANVEILCWLFEKTADSRLLALAEGAYALFLANPAYREWFGCDLDFAGDRPPTTHGVVYLELVKIPALLYAATGKREYLDAALQGVQTMEVQSMLVSGLPSSTEHFEGRDETGGHETCNTAVLPYTYGVLLRLTDDPTFADRIEKAVFNAGFGSVTKDFCTHQYFSAPNQPVVATDSNPYGHHPARLAYQKAHDVQCCTGNVNRFLPYFTEQLWLSDHSSGTPGLTAALYAPCTVTAPVGLEGATVIITEETAYPFEHVIRFRVALARPVQFPLRLRIPVWSLGATVTVNGAKLAVAEPSGGWTVVEREFHDGDVVVLELQAAVTASRWPNGGCAFEYGPLVFSLPVASGEPWNYSVAPSLDRGQSAELVRRPASGYPWDSVHTPLSLRVNARHLSSWKLRTFVDARHGKPVTVVAAFPKNRRVTGPPAELSLLPYGCTTARITVFPVHPQEHP